MIFWTKFTQNRIFAVKIGKSKHHHLILHIQTSLGTEFQLKLTILIFWTKFVQKEYFRSKSEKNQYRHSILHIRISRGTRFQLKLTILNFRTKFAQKGYFRWKTEKVKSPFDWHIGISLQSRTKYSEQNGVIQENSTGKEKFGIWFFRVF